MSKQVKNLVPKLRFTDFKNAEEWKIKPLGETCAILNNRRMPISSDKRSKGAYPYYGASGIVDYVSDYIFDERLLLIGEDGAKWGAFENTAFIVEGKYWVNNHAHVLKALEVNHVLLSNYLVMLDLSKYVTGAAPPKLTLGKLKQIPVYYPKQPEEQQKIADCLSSLDDLIAAQNQKVEALKQHKKGLMQQLFPAEGETVPKLRFPKFENDGEWALTEIGKFIEEYRKNSTHQDEHEVLTSARNGLIRQRDYFDNDRITERDNIGFNIIPPNYLTYRSRSDDRRFYFNENLLGITGIISTYYPVFKIKNGVNKFFVELLASYSDHVGKHSVGTSQTVLSLNVLKKIELPFPSPKEQKNIADCLSSLDDLITAQTQQLEAYKSHKKGLMQQLFPSLDEVAK